MCPAPCPSPCSTLSLQLKLGERAKAAMLKANYRLVVNIAKKYQGRGMSMVDLTTEGMQVGPPWTRVSRLSPLCPSLALPAHRA